MKSFNDYVESKQEQEQEQKIELVPSKYVEDLVKKLLKKQYGGFEYTEKSYYGKDHATGFGIPGNTKDADIKIGFNNIDISAIGSFENRTMWVTKISISNNESNLNPEFLNSLLEELQGMGFLINIENKRIDLISVINQHGLVKLKNQSSSEVTEFTAPRLRDYIEKFSFRKLKDVIAPKYTYGGPPNPKAKYGPAISGTNIAMSADNKQDALNNLSWQFQKDDWRQI